MEAYFSIARISKVLEDVAKNRAGDASLPDTPIPPLFKSKQKIN